MASAPPASPLPSGLVTFALSDVEGSTRLLQRLGDTYRELLDEHRRLLTEAYASYGGVVVDSPGDALLAAFPDPADAVRAAVAAQQALAEYDWPDEGRVAVRIGMHTGPAEPVQDNYVALAVHQAARISAAGHGGQVVLSAAVATAAGRLEGIDVTPLGQYLLKDFDGPQVVHQATDTSAPREFPSLRTPRAVAAGVVTDRTPFVGREFDRIELQATLDRVQLVTVVGPGGVGKSRLARKAAQDRTADHGAGVWVVSLSGVPDSAGVAGAVAAAVGAGSETEDPLTAVVARLGATDALVVLDGCEHVLDGAAESVAALLSAGPDVRVLATSREPLGIAGEVVQALAPMELPRSEEKDASAISASEAVRFFLAQAEQAKPGFVLDSRNAEAVAALCRRLDGLPLALRLAAARLRVLTPQQLLDRLDASFRALGTGDRDSLPHHRTLDAAIAWSYDALTEREQQVFCRLGALPDGGPVEAVEAACSTGDDDDDLLDVLSVLAQRSLVSVSGDEAPRWRMLDTVRAFAEARLVERGEHRAVRERYADWLALFMENLELDGPSNCARADAEANALRALLQDATLPTGSLHRLVAGTGQYWLMRSIREGRDLCLPHVQRSDGPVNDRLRALLQTSHLCGESGDPATGQALAAEAVALAPQATNKRMAIYALSTEATFHLADDPQRALHLLAEAQAAAEELGDDGLRAVNHSRVAVIAHGIGDWPLARMHNEAALHLWNQVGNRRNVATSLYNLAELDAREAPALARERLDEAVAITTGLGEQQVLAHALALRGQVALRQGETEAARTDLTVAAELHQSLGNEDEHAAVLSDLARLDETAAAPS